MAKAAPCIWVLAGTNGAGKSTIGGEFLRRSGGEYFNPDEIAKRLRKANPGLDAAAANARAWQLGLALLEQAIASRREYFFETTLGGDTITARLEKALTAGLEVRIWYVGLDSPEHHIARVKARVRKGGHDIPEADIRRRYRNSQLNLIRLLPKLTELKVHDNSAETDPAAGAKPTPPLMLHVQRGRIIAPKDLGQTPEWAKAIVAAAVKLARKR